MDPACFQDLVTALKGALSGSLETLMLGLMKSTVQYDACELKASMKVGKHLGPTTVSAGTNVVFGVSGPGDR